MLDSAADRKLGRWHIEQSVKISDFLTFVTIVISLLVLSNNLQQDLALREREQANRIRTAAAKILTNLETLQSLQLSLFEELQPVYVDVSQRLYEPLEIRDAADLLWQSTTQKIAAIDKEIVDKEILAGYADLLVDFPGIRDRYLVAMASIADTRTANYSEFLRAADVNVTDYPLIRGDYQSVMLGNDLRETSDYFRQSLKQETDKIIDPLRRCILDIIGKTDSELLRNPGCP